MSYFRDLPTLAKLGILTLFAGSLIAWVGHRGVQGMDDQSAMLNTLYERDLVGVVAADRAALAQANLARLTRQLMLDNGTAEEASDQEQYRAAKLELDQRLEALDRQIATQAGREAYLELTSLKPHYDDASDRAVAHHGRLDGEAREAMLKLHPIGSRMRELLGTVVDAEIALGRKTYQDSAARSQALRREAVALVLLAISGTLAIAILVVRAISGPLKQTAALLASVAGGDLSRRVEVSSRDEVGRTGASLNHALDKLSAALGAVDSRANQLAVASQSLASIGQQLGGTSEEGSAQAASLAAAAEEVSSNVRTISTSVAEMNSAVREIAKNSGDATGLAQEGADAAKQVRILMGELGSSSSAIGAVVKLISSIAEQTNLLALNATIEAARAGEAGKGFAVVANEVKELAKASAASTGEIAAKVAAIQSATTRSIDAIGKVTDIISRIAAQQAMVAAAVEEQVATTNEIGRNVEEASRASSEIARNATGVADVSKGTSRSAQAALEQANRLAATAAELRAQVAQFNLVAPAAGTSSGNALAQGRQVEGAQPVLAPSS